VWLRVDVFESDAAHVHVGDRVEATVSAWGTRVFSGAVTYVAQSLDPARRTLEAVVEIANEDDALKPGMTARARVISAERTHSAHDAGAGELVIPRGAVQSIDGQPFVFVRVGEGQFAMRAVETGGESGDDVVVRAGLRDDETLAVAGTFILKSEALREQMGKND
jgi:cobalt-zinc-cadmium efflux system membrane fusion protein